MGFNVPCVPYWAQLAHARQMASMSVDIFWPKDCISGETETVFGSSMGLWDFIQRAWS